jgi:predicted nucleic acid-binding protein
MWLIDTNVFIYAAGKPHPHQEGSLKILEKSLTNPQEYNIDTEILQEILHVYHNRKEKNKGMELVENILRMFPQPFPISAKDILKCCAILKKYEINVRDALHAAVIENHNLEGIITYDKHFYLVKEFKVVMP